MSATVVLVTGVAGDFGQALVKALRFGEGAPVVHGCDLEAGSIGAAFVASFHVVPRADDPGYLSALDALCRSLEAAAVIPGSEAEIFRLSRLGSPPRLPGGAPVVCQEGAWIDTYGDKLRCMQALAGRVELAPFADGADRPAVDALVAEAAFPLVVKERWSSGSRSLRVAADRAALETHLAEAKEPLVQAFIDDEDGEFSLGIFATPARVDAIAFRRRLGPSIGCTWYAEWSDDAAVLAYGVAVARASGARGSVNVQVRKGRAGVRLLEINPRFSSLAAARSACGFPDVRWALDAALGRPLLAVPPPQRSLRFQRYFAELIDVGSGFERVPAWDPRLPRRPAP